MKQVLVTGAAGFLGSHLAKHHLDAGDQVWGIDDFSSSNPRSGHLEALLQDGLTFIDGDICKDWRRWAPDYVQFSLIYNFACPASPPIYQRIPIKTLLTCTQGVNNILDLADYTNAVVVHASTSEVYGDPEHTPQAETYRGCVNSYGPRSCYDEGKRAAEALCYDWLNQYGLDVRLVRIFNTYGPQMDPKDGRVVSNFICQALRGEQLTVYGDGMQGRSFCYVDDLVRGITALARIPTNPRMPINLGNPYEFSVLDLAHQVGRKVQHDAYKLRFAALPKDDPTQRCPDITVAKQLLDWQPTVQLAEGLDRTIAYFRSVLR